MNKFLDRSSTLLISTSVPPESVRPGLYKAKACTAGYEFGCCAVCSTTKKHEAKKLRVFLSNPKDWYVILRQQVCNRRRRM